MRISLIILLVFTMFSLENLSAQEDSIRQNVYAIYDQDTIPVKQLRPVHVFALPTFKNMKEREKYTRLVRDVSIAYPYARMVANSIIETYEYMETLPDEKTKQKHLEAVQKYMMETYKPKMKKMTRRQGQILIKLIDRECNTSSYTIVSALLGSFKAGLYNTLAGIFGNSLKTTYDPLGKDKDIENIVIQIEEGTFDYYYSLLAQSN